MAQDSRSTYNPFLQGIGATSPYSSYLDTKIYSPVFKEPKKRKFGEILPGEVDVSRGGRILRDIGGGILSMLKPPPMSPYEKLFSPAFSYLSEKPQSEEFLQAQRDKDFASQIRPAGILGLQDEIEEARKAVTVTPIPGKSPDINSIGVVRPSFQSPTPIQDFETIDKSVPGDMSVLQESVSQETEFTDKETIGGDPKSTNPEDLLNSSLVELYGPSKSLTGEDRTKAIEQYKKDFYEATGLDPSGKPDTKDAMVAFGLALMQNKAGKKLNIRKIFGEVGKAGEKVLPLIQQAKKESKSGQIAAGQFALGELSKEDERRSESKREQRQFKLSLIADNIKRSEDLKYEILKAHKLGDPNKVEKFLNVAASNIKIAGDPITINRGTEQTGKRVYLDPETDIIPLSNAYAKTEAGLNSIDDALFLVQDIQNTNKKNIGGTVAFLTKSKLTSIANVLGFTPKEFKATFGSSVDDLYVKDENTGELTLKTQKLKSIQSGLIARFKRFLTQETGNGISNVDVERLERLTASLDNVFTNPQEALQNLQEVKGMFLESRSALDNTLDGFLRRDQYKTGEVGQKEFESVQKRIDKDLEKFFGDLEVSVKDGQLFYDLTKDA